MIHVRHNTGARATVVAALIVAVATGCGTTPEPDPYAPLGGDAAVASYRWFAEGDIDLESPEMQVVRAYVESLDAWLRTKDKDAVYTGFDDFIDPDSDPAPQRGTVNLHVFDVEPDTDFEGRPSTRVGVCFDYSGRPEENSDTGEWRIRRTAYYDSMYVTRTDPATPNSPAIDPQHRLPYPTWNVFDGWDVQRFNDMRTDPESPRTRCLNDPPFDLRAYRNPPVRIPPVVEPAGPGWPTVIDG